MNTSERETIGTLLYGYIINVDIQLYRAEY